jgi:CBS domain-containing protein
LVVKAVNKVAGLLTLCDLEGIPRYRWPSFAVSEVMIRTDSLRQVEPETTLRIALEEMDLS